MCDFPDNTPLPLAVAYAQTNRMMKGAKAAGRVKIDGGLFGFRFDVKETHTAVLWVAQVESRGNTHYQLAECSGNA